MAEAAQRALLDAEWERALMSGSPRKTGERRFYSTDLANVTLADDVMIVRSPGEDAEQAVAKSEDVYVLHFALKVSRWSGRDGVLIDSRMITRRWIADDQRMHEESFDASYCVRRLDERRFEIVQVAAEMWPSPVTSEDPD